jgi:hypothetical protein
LNTGHPKLDAESRLLQRIPDPMQWMAVAAQPVNNACCDKIGSSKPCEAEPPPSGM